ncbi:hypothetical protein DL89DRAFT_295686 [Linderina pennispora]|uniref:R3H domain-containing protein n=1 Tax=Linderina pennispora TaxID=61395 RepID=A0A1Y1VY45_9FUNG|nr:uncharacterized protein DL89DRAFT_295686 [Linderina pennispora]ORX66191.1 hypothetical protein DL89DRAFT_295686 [Linderina pennispora]
MSVENVPAPVAILADNSPVTSSAPIQPQQQQQHTRSSSQISSRRNGGNSRQRSGSNSSVNTANQANSKPRHFGRSNAHHQQPRSQSRASARNGASSRNHSQQQQQQHTVDQQKNDSNKGRQHRGKKSAGTRHENQQAEEHQQDHGASEEKTRRRRNRKRKGGNVGGGRQFDGKLSAKTAAPAVMEDEDLGSSLTRQLTNSSYECMILLRQGAAAARHLAKWAKSCTGSDVGDGSTRWRCPGCQYARAAAPSHYVCFCGATRDPEPVRGCVPHSCGRLCGKSRGKRCPHRCPLPCHPGPCPPCTEMAPEQSCYCGRLVYQPKCGSSYDPELNVKSCGNICDEMLGCGKHRCDKPCHPGLCPPCPRDEQQMCYCGSHTRTAKCGAGRVQTTFVSGMDGPQTGFYSCGNSTSADGHAMRSPTPAAAMPTADCPLDPTVVSTCHCGATLASDLGQARLTYPDAPTRAMKSATLAHAHPAPQRSRTPCRLRARPGSGQQPTCQRVCSRMRVCGRHRCNAKCCGSDHVDIDGAVIPSEALAPGTTDAHHGTSARSLAIAGHAHPAWRRAFDELACACGRTRLYPPIACGTTLPVCHHPCTRVRACGHISMMSHECHPDDMKNIPCHRSAMASCGTICNKLLPCGGHRCQRSCHRPDEPCLRGGQTCRQACGKPRKTCGHPRPVTVVCECGRKSLRELCGSTAANGRSAMRRIPCDDVCKIAMRNRRLALALDLPDKAQAPLAGLFARSNLTWVREIEAQVGEFVGGSRRPVLRFAPMKRSYRAFLHALAAFYGCSSRSMDREPVRSVCWERTQQATIPSIVLSNAIRYITPPQIVCSERVNAADNDDEFDDSASHVFDGVAASSNPAADRLRKKFDYLVLSDLKHGLTQEELQGEIARLMPYASFSLRWKDPDVVEMYCTDTEMRAEHLVKWEGLLKHKLPFMGLVGSVVGERSVLQQPAPSQQPASKPPHSRKEAAVPEDWESLNIPSDSEDVPDDL